MTDKVQKIKQEIENQRNEYNKIWKIAHSDDLESHVAYANQSLLDRLLKFIDSLPEEPASPEEFASKDLDEEIERCWKEMFPIGWSDYTLLTLTYEQHKAFAHHYTEWQKKKDFQDFLEKAERWLEPTFKSIAGYNCGGDLMNNFKNYMQDEIQN